MLSLPEDWQKWLQTAPNPNTYHTAAELASIQKDWLKQGIPLIDLGLSREGKEIKASLFGTGSKTLLAWGYPHPEEPLGAEALVWLGNGLIEGSINLEDFKIAMILCADPDQTSRQKWLSGPRTAKNFVSGCFRPTHLGLEVDYGFPLEWGEFSQPKDAEGLCRMKSECLERCGEECKFINLPYAPLPESLALAKAIELFEPTIVASLHSTFAGGDYTFLLERESPEVLNDLIEIPASVGSLRYLGEPIDRGRRWKKDAPDLIHEPNLESFTKRLHKHHSYEEGWLYGGNHSASAFVESQENGCQFVCPEAALFRHNDFAVTDLVNEEVDVWVSVEDRPRAGRSRVWRSSINDELVIISQEKTPGLRRQKMKQIKQPLTRSYAAVSALWDRREALHESDIIWNHIVSLDDLVLHPYFEERQSISVPGKYVHDQALRIFRSDPSFRKTINTAQLATYRFLWPLHTAWLLGGMSCFLDEQDLNNPVIGQAKIDLEGIQDRMLRQLPAEMLVEGDRAPSLKSIIGRLMILMNARKL